MKETSSRGSNPFSLTEFEAVLGINRGDQAEYQIHDQIKHQIVALEPKIQADLSSGFAEVTSDGMTREVLSWTQADDWEFSVACFAVTTEKLIRSKIFLEANVSVGEDAVVIQVSAEGLMISSSIWVNNQLVAIRDNPFDNASLDANAALRMETVQSGGDLETLDRAITPERCPYFIAAHMLDRYASSTVNLKQILLSRSQAEERLRGIEGSWVENPYF